jgi:hypothetical protein
MKRLEIISVRTSVHDEKQARLCLQEICRSADWTSATDMQFFVNADVLGDLAVILTWRSDQAGNQKSDLGMILAETMKRFGLVDHACWLAMENRLS